MRKNVSMNSGLLTFYQNREGLKKKKSPPPKSKSKGKLTKKNQNSVLHTNKYPNSRDKKTTSFHHNESNDSSTQHTTLKTKKSKGSFHRKKSTLKKYERQIMEVLHTSAAIIQRQWRKYLIRKYQKSYRKSIQQQKDLQVSISMNPKKQQKEEKSVSICTEQQSDVFNNQKYFSCHSINSPRKLPQNTISKNIFSFNSSEKKQLENPQGEFEFGDSSSSIKLRPVLGHHRTSSDLIGMRISNNSVQNNFQNEQSKPVRMSLEARTVNLSVSGCKQKKKMKKKKKYEDQYIPTDKGIMQKVLQRYEKQLQQKKLKKILALENRFSNNLLTFRSYEKSVNEITQSHKNKLCILQSKKDKILHNWEQIFQLYDKSVIEDEKQWEGEKSLVRHLVLNDSDFSIDDFSDNFNGKSVAFEEWEIQSDKKIPTQQQLEPTKESNNPMIKSCEKSKEIVKLESNQILIREDKQDDEINQIIEEEAETLKNEGNEKQRKQKIEESQEKQNKKVEEQKTPTKNRWPIMDKSRFVPIDPVIQHVNSWLLEVSHYLLDHHNGQLLTRLTNIEQPPSSLLLYHCMQQIPISLTYSTVPEKLFKEFEYFHIKGLVEQLNLEKDRKDTYSALVFCFHRCLLDALNEMLLDELLWGRKWLLWPWQKECRMKRVIVKQHCKQCLERSINRVSTIADYDLYPINKLYKYGAENEEIHRNLICLEEVRAIPLDYEQYKAQLILSVTQLIQCELLSAQTKFFHQAFNQSLIFTTL